MAAGQAILLCCDLDRTLIPNGNDRESPSARPLFRKLAARSDVLLAYVSGRHIGLIDDAISAYGLPVPDYAVGDVGSTVYRRAGADWQPLDDWWQEIRLDWGTYTHADIQAVLETIEGLDVQPPEGQNTFKLSFFVARDHDIAPLLNLVRDRLDGLATLRYSLIWSIDEAAGVGLLDVLPLGATKLHAMEFLMRLLSIDESRVVFAGDSGNDLPVLCSGHQSVLVRNAPDEVKVSARDSLANRGLSGRLYVASGGFMGMNGHYSAGVLEGLAHFMPELRAWMRGGG